MVKKDCFDILLIAGFLCKLVIDVFVVKFGGGDCDDNNFSLNYYFLKMALRDFLEFLLTTMG